MLNTRVFLNSKFNFLLMELIDCNIRETKKYGYKANEKEKRNQNVRNNGTHVKQIDVYREYFVSPLGRRFYFYSFTVLKPIHYFVNLPFLLISYIFYLTQQSFFVCFLSCCAHYYMIRLKSLLVACLNLCNFSFMICVRHYKLFKRGSSLVVFNLF